MAFDWNKKAYSAEKRHVRNDRSLREFVRRHPVEVGAAFLLAVEVLVWWGVS